MIDWVFTLVMVWHAGLLLLLLVHAGRSRELSGKLIAFDGVSLVFLSALVVIAAHRGEVRLIEIALILAMLVFTQTLAAARLIRKRRLEE